MIDDDDLDRLRAHMLRLQAAFVEQLPALRKAAAACERIVDLYYAPYEAERAVAHFEGRTPVSPEVFFHQRFGDAEQ